MNVPHFLKSRVDDIDTIGVLIVSPDSKLRLELRARLNNAHWRLAEAASGAEAIECLRESFCELLLLDPMLPDLESIEFGAIVREQFPNVQIL